MAKGGALYETFRDNGALWRWRLRDPKGIIVAVSPESYVTREGAEGSRDSMIHWAGLATKN
jgi:uncharacterized protein YegP (UPF0339 family)